MKTTIRALLIGLCCAMLPGLAGADSLALPQGKVILTVTGAIGETNRGADAVFDAAMLADLDRHVIRTGTPWDDGVSEFEGIRVSVLLAAVRASGDVLQVAALDGYVVDIPVSDFAAYDAILAWARDGKIMSVREKGPLWLMYPFDSDPDLQVDKYSARSVWQIERIAVK